MIVAFVPISGAADDTDVQTSDDGSSIDLKVGVSSEDVKNTQTALQTKKPFGEKTNDKILKSDDNGDLKLGSSGDKVKELQKWLTDYGYYSGDVDGEFGADTEKAVELFQEEAGLIVDGVVGDDTRKAMKNWDKYVAEVQAAADEQGYTPQATATTTNRQYYANAVRSYTGITIITVVTTITVADKWGCWDIVIQPTIANIIGQRARIIQYSNSYSPRHRSVQTWNGNSWVDYNNVPWVGYTYCSW
jgi:N-acetylmuramoyl-L-alanine amidase